MFKAEEISKMRDLQAIAMTLAATAVSNLVTGPANPVTEYCPNGLIIAGGVFTSLIQGTEINDIDLFVLDPKKEGVKRFNDISADARKRAWTYVYPTDYNRSPSPGWDCAPNPSHPSHRKGVTAIYERILPICFNNLLPTDTKFQLIFTEYDSREQLLSDFDYEHSRISYEHSTVSKGVLYSSYLSYECNVKKKLVAHIKEENIKPKRLQKFLNRGWTK